MLRHLSRRTPIDQPLGRIFQPPEQAYIALLPLVPSARCRGLATQSAPIKLRPYQEECIQAVLKYLKDDGSRAGISLATGSGKTVIFSHLLDRFPAPTSDATQTLILAHRRELVEQAARHCREQYPEKHVDVDMANQRASGLADITVASINSIVSPDRIRRYDPGRFKLVVVDEAHHIVAPTYLKVLEHFGLIEINSKKTSPTALVGVSATFSRLDGKELGLAIDDIVYHKDWMGMINEGWLSDIVFTTVHSGADLARVKLSGDDFQTSALSKAVNNEVTNTITVRSWLARASERRSTLGFCVDVAHVMSLAATFLRHGVDARFVTGKTGLRERSERLSAFRAGKFPVLLNCGIYTEGTDVPNIDCVLLARPTKSRELLVQMIGRGLRKSPGKHNCHVIDMVASLETGIVTAPTLFGLDPTELLDEADLDTMKDIKERREHEQLQAEDASLESPRPHHQVPNLTGNISFTDYDSVNDLIEDASGERHIRAISSFAWVQVDTEKYILSSSVGDYIQLDRSGEVDQERWLVFVVQKLRAGSSSKSPFMRRRQIAESDTFEGAVHGADTFAAEKYPFKSIHKLAYWRKLPATDKQLEYLNKFRAEDDQLTASSTIAGKAGDMITKRKHGAKSRFNKIQLQKRQNQKQREREEKQRRGEIGVGPVAS